MKYAAYLSDGLQRTLTQSIKAAMGSLCLREEKALYEMQVGMALQQWEMIRDMEHSDPISKYRAMASAWDIVDMHIRSVVQINLSIAKIEGTAAMVGFDTSKIMLRDAQILEMLEEEVSEAVKQHRDVDLYRIADRMKMELQTVEAISATTTLTPEKLDREARMMYESIPNPSSNGHLAIA